MSGMNEAELMAADPEDPRGAWTPRPVPASIATLSRGVLAGLGEVFARAGSEAAADAERRRSEAERKAEELRLRIAALADERDLREAAVEQEMETIAKAMDRIRAAFDGGTEAPDVAAMPVRRADREEDAERQVKAPTDGTETEWKAVAPKTATAEPEAPAPARTRRPSGDRRPPGVPATITIAAPAELVTAFDSMVDAGECADRGEATVILVAEALASRAAVRDGHVEEPADAAGALEAEPRRATTLLNVSSEGSAFPPSKAAMEPGPV